MSLEIELAHPTSILRFDLDFKIDGTLRRIISMSLTLPLGSSQAERTEDQWPPKLTLA